MKRNAYQILGVEPTASQAEIKQKYDEVVRVLNGAKSGPDPELMAAVLAAGAVLGNPQAREQYDVQLARQLIPSGGKSRSRKILAARIGGGVLAVCCLAAGAWFAWDRGIIPGNTRALNLTVVDPIVRRLAMANASQRPFICASPELGSPAPESRGAPEIEPGLAPGLFSVILAKESVSNPQSRDRQLRQMEFLAKQGYFRASDVTIRTTAGEKPGRHFALTWEGFARLAPGGSTNQPCFIGGKFEYVTTTSINKEGREIGGFDSYDATYSMKIVDVEKWAEAPDLNDLFPGFTQSMKSLEHHALVVRGRDGWLSAQEIMAQMTLLQSGQAQMMSQYLKSLSSVPLPPNAETARELMTFHLKSEAGVRRLEGICIALNLLGAGDDLEAGKRGIRNIFTYQDKSDRPPFSLRDLAKRISILEALTASDAAVRENGTGPMPVAGEAASSPTAQVKNAKVARTPVPAGPAWVRYRVDPATAELLGMGRSGSGCVPLGPAKTQYLAYLSSPGGRNMNGGVALLRATFESPPESTKRLAERIPAIHAAVVEGIALTAKAEFIPGNMSQEKVEAVAGEWKFQYLNPILPQIKASDFPPQWLALMPLTAELASKDPTIAGGSPVVSTPSPPVTKPSPAPSPASPSPPASSPSLQKRSAAPILQTGKSSLHVISIHESEVGGGKIPQGLREGIVKINLEASEKPVSLVIDSYEPVHWIINANPGSNLQKIVASGYHPQRVTITGATRVPIEMSGEGPRYKERDESSRQTATAWSTVRFNLAPVSVQVAHKASEFFIPPKADAATKS